MKAALITAVNKIDIMDRPMPKLDDEQALIHVKYCGICGTEGHMLHGKFHKLNFPIIPGHEFVGQLADIKTNNPQLAGFKVGDWVVAQPYQSCETCVVCKEGGEHYCKNIKVMGTYIDGGFAEYVAVPAKKLIKIDNHADMKKMALTEPFAIGIHDTLEADVRLGNSVFIIGAGVIATMLALACRLSGALDVTLCDINEYKLDFAKSLGFRTLNSSASDFLEQAMALSPNGIGYDHVFEASGSAFGVRMMTELAIPGGIVMQTGVANEYLPVNIASFTINHIQIRGARLHTFKDYIRSARIIESGIESEAFSKLVTHVFPIEEFEKAMDVQLNESRHMKILIENTHF